VVGMGLKNEPRRVCAGRAWHGKGSFCDISFLNVSSNSGSCMEPSWASGPEHLQYRIAAQRAGQAILAQDPRFLISICGLDYGTRLEDVAQAPPDLPSANVVYEAHEYSWFWHHKNDESSDLPRCVMERSWGYLLRSGIAPVVVTEFGMGHHWFHDSGTKRWFQLMTSYLQGGGPLGGHGGLDWMYWQLGGVQLAGTSREQDSVETFGVLNHCWTGPANAEHAEAIFGLMVDPVTASEPDLATLRCGDSGPDNSPDDGGRTWLLWILLAALAAAVCLALAVLGACIALGKLPRFVGRLSAGASHPARVPSVDAIGRGEADVICGTESQDACPASSSHTTQRTLG